VSKPISPKRKFNLKRNDNLAATLKYKETKQATVNDLFLTEEKKGNTYMQEI